MEQCPDEGEERIVTNETLRRPQNPSLFLIDRFSERSSMNPGSEGGVSGPVGDG